VTGTSPSHLTLLDRSEPYEAEREVYPEQGSRGSSNGEGVVGRDRAGERQDLNRFLDGRDRGGRPGLLSKAGVDRVYASVWTGYKGVMLRLMTLAIVLDVLYMRNANGESKSMVTRSELYVGLVFQRRGPGRTMSTRSGL
jgi:hypothetical protein